MLLALVPLAAPSCVCVYYCRTSSSSPPSPWPSPLFPPAPSRAPSSSFLPPARTGGTARRPCLGFPLFSHHRLQRFASQFILVHALRECNRHPGAKDGGVRWWGESTDRPVQLPLPLPLPRPFPLPLPLLLFRGLFLGHEIDALLALLEHRKPAALSRGDAFLSALRTHALKLGSWAAPRTPRATNNSTDCMCTPCSAAPAARGRR